ncbi:MAG: L-threonylcarbamoyladenylate synthase [Arenicella sp.]
MDASIKHAVAALRRGGVIAYPTEYCFGFGCDPRNQAAIARLLTIKQRRPKQGVILVAASLEQISCYAELENLARLKQITDSWPGPNTWVMPAKPSVSAWIRGDHSSIAMRISDHPTCVSLCFEFDHAIVSTSANRHGQDALLSAADVNREFAGELDYIVDEPVGDASRASIIRDAITGEQFR